MTDRLEVYLNGTLFAAIEIDSNDHDWGSKLSTLIYQALRNFKKQDM